MKLPSRQRSPALCMLALASVLLASCASGPSSGEVRSRADALLADLHARGLFNGAVVLGRDGKILYESAWGPADAAAGVLLTPDSPVDGASLAKNFTAAAVWLLAGEGKLDLDAPVQRYVQEFPHEATTVRHLLENSAGLPDWSDLPERYEPDRMTNAQLVAALRETGTQPVFSPGSRYAYCNTCYDVAALVIERTSGLGYEAFLRQRVFGPLGMDSTFLRPVRLKDWRGVRTRSYLRRAGTRISLDVADGEAFYGSANLYFSTRDLHRWATSFYADPVLRPTALARALEVPVLSSGERSALNLLNWYHAADRERFYFNGHLLGFHHEVYWDRRLRFSIVWVSNDRDARPLPQFLTRALVDVMEGRTPAPISAPERDQRDVAERFSAVEGTYDVNGIGRVTVLVEGDLVRVRVADGDDHDCYGGSDCYVPDFDAAITFSDISEGRYQRLDWVAVFRVTTGKRVS
jgi:CubicO group peptidase (beta-lactamase class C family)